MRNSFDSLFRRWFIHQRDNEDLARQLEALCDEAWRSRERGTLDDVMTFVFMRKHTKRYEYFFDALQSSDKGVVLQAIGYIGALATEGYDFNPGHRAAIAKFAQQHPDLQDLVDDLVPENDSSQRESPPA